jgi:hypothetical protein
MSGVLVPTIVSQYVALHRNAARGLTRRPDRTWDNATSCNELRRTAPALSVLTTSRSGVRVPQRPLVVKNTTFPLVRRHFSCPVAQVGSFLIQTLQRLFRSGVNQAVRPGPSWNSCREYRAVPIATASCRPLRPKRLVPPGATQIHEPTGNRDSWGRVPMSGVRGRESQRPSHQPELTD